MTTCISKSELARKLGVSVGTTRRYIRAVEKKLPHYHSTQKILTPDQYAVLKEHYCIE